MSLSSYKNKIINHRTKPLDFIYLLDTSGSMEGDKIDALNRAMHELEPYLLKEARKNPDVTVNIQILTFGDDNIVNHTNGRVEVEQFKYNDIYYVNGSTPLHLALEEVNNILDENNMPNNSKVPVVVLLSDGIPSYDYKNQLNKFLNSKWGSKAIKFAIAFGSDADRDVLAEFTTDMNRVINPNNAKELINAIKWTSTLISTASRHNGNTPKVTPGSILNLSDDD